MLMIILPIKCSLIVIIIIFHFSLFRVPQPKCVNVAIDCDREIERIHSLFLINLEKLDELQGKLLLVFFCFFLFFFVWLIKLVKLYLNINDWWVLPLCTWTCSISFIVFNKSTIFIHPPVYVHLHQVYSIFLSVLSPLTEYLLLNA